MSNVAQRSFAGGEIAPPLYGRTDTARYQTSLRTCRNMIVQQHGGAVNRPGTQYVAEVKNSNLSVRLIKFSKNELSANNYVLEFGHLYMRVHQAGLPVRISAAPAWANATVYVYGDVVSQGGVNYVCILGHTSLLGTNQPGVDAFSTTYWYALTSNIYELPTPYLYSDLADLQFQQAGDVITIVHPTYAPRELTRTNSTKWQFAAIIFGPSISPPTNITLTGGAAGPLTYFAITAIKKDTFEESLPVIISTTTKVPSTATPTTVEWDIVKEAVSYNVYRSADGKTYGLILSSGGTPVITEDTAWADNAETATANPGDVGWKLSPGTISNPLAGITAKVKAFDGKYRVLGRTTRTAAPFSTSGENQARIGVYYSRDGEADVLWGYQTLEPLGFGVLGATWGPLPLEFVIDVPDNGYASLTIKMRPEVRQFNPGSVGSFLDPFGTPANEECSVTQTFVVDFSGAAPYNRIDWNAGSSSFIDDGDAPDFAIGPLAHPQLFSSANNYPSAITRYQQRLSFANSNSEQAKVWASRVGSRKSFAFSTPLQADDAINFELDSRYANPIKHLLDLGRLIVFTSQSEVVVEGDEAGVLRPDSINARSHSYNGANRLSPLVVNDLALYIQARGSSVRMINPADRVASQNTNLSLFASHLFLGKSIVDWDFALTPNSVAWLVRSDGVLLGLTFIPELDIWGWHRHDTDGVVENVCVIPEGNEDAVYVVVQRTINQVTKRYVERMTSRYFADIKDAWFVDAGTRIDGTNTALIGMTLSGSGYTYQDQLTITASAAYFAAADVGDSIWFTADDGTEIEFVLEAFTSNVIMTGRPARDVPVELQNTGTFTWARARRTITGLSHLAGKSVAVYADGFVVASPNNAEYPVLTVTNAGAIVLPKAYRKVLVGLPIISDLETLDIDVAGPRTLKGRRTLVSKVVLFLEATRGLWVGPPNRPTAALPLRGMQELKIRSSEAYQSPVAPITDSIDVTIESNWNSNGRILVRQVDPLPCSILMVSPEFSDT